MSDPRRDIYLGRQPILDRKEQLFAYELLFRSSTRNVAMITDDTSATATVLSHVFTDLGLEAALGPYKGFVNLNTGMLMSDTIELLPPDRFVLELLETVEITTEVARRCRELKDRGFALALDDVVYVDRSYAPLLELADFVKVDIQPLSEKELEATVETLKRWPVTLLAEKVDSEGQVQYCRKLGFELFQGYFFAKPAIISGKKLNHSELALMRLLSLVMEEADTSAIEDVFKQEPALALNLLRLTNSAASGLRQHITSLRHALAVLGRRQLQRWLQLLLYTNAAKGAAVGALLQLAATRGRMMELLAALIQPTGEFSDRAFMTGVMSLMPVALGVPLESLLEGLHVAGEIKEALSDRSGRLGILLSLAEKVDENDPEGIAALAAQLPSLDAEAVNACLAQALAWANNLGQPG